MIQIKDVLKEWPPSKGNWGGFYSRGNGTDPDLKTATIKDCHKDHLGDIYLSIVSGDRQFSTVLYVQDTSYANRIVEVLSSAVGSLLDDAGRLEV